MTMREAREAAGFTLSDVAELLQVGRRTLQGWEDGRSWPRVSVFLMLCALYRVGPNDIKIDLPATV